MTMNEILTTSGLIIKSIYRWNNQKKFRKSIARGELEYFRSTMIRAGAEPEGYDLSYSI